MILNDLKACLRSSGGTSVPGSHPKTDGTKCICLMRLSHDRSPSLVSSESVEHPVFHLNVGSHVPRPTISPTKYDRLSFASEAIFDCS